MLELPENFKGKIMNRYAEKGQEWLNNLDTLIEKYTKKFELSDIQLIENLSINLVLLAKSEVYGDVVMKIGAPGPSTITEISLMQKYPPKYVPKCYFSSLDDGIMILEKISPGYPLIHLENLEERVKVFCDLSNHLLLPAKDTGIFSTFDELVKKRMEYAYQNKANFSDISWMIEMAEKIHKKIKAMNLSKYILHDDLHHKNILKSQTGWKAIDPHGIIGEKVIEVAQFIRFELEKTDLTEDNIDKIVTLVSQHFKEDKKLILEALFVVIVSEKIIWFIKNKENSQKVSYNIEVCKKLLNMLKG